jgi:hypothetical protein
MADDWPDWLPDNLKVEPCVLYSVRQVSADTFTLAFADPLGSTIWCDVPRDQLITRPFNALFSTTTSQGSNEKGVRCAYRPCSAKVAAFYCAPRLPHTHGSSFVFSLADTETEFKFF